MAKKSFRILHPGDRAASPGEIPDPSAFYQGVTRKPLPQFLTRGTGWLPRPVLPGFSLRFDCPISPSPFSVPAQFPRPHSP